MLQVSWLHVIVLEIDFLKVAGYEAFFRVVGSWKCQREGSLTLGLHELTTLVGVFCEVCLGLLNGGGGDSSCSIFKDVAAAHIFLHDQTLPACLG